MEKEPISVIESLGLHAAFDAKEEGGADEKRRLITEAYFGTSNDPDQIPVAKSSLEKLKQLSCYCINCAYEGDNPVSWTIAIPTSVGLMESFLREEITERTMFDKTQVGDMGALYLCSAFTLGEFRGKGIAKELLTKQVAMFLGENPDMEVFAWAWSKEGGKLVGSLPVDIVKRVRIRE
jgi:hypothetical protein